MVRHSWQLLALQGRIDDRSPNATRGSLLLAQALAGHVGRGPELIGSPAPHKVEDWQSSLENAGALLGEIATAVEAVLTRGEKPLLIASSCAAALAALPVALAKTPRMKVIWIDAHGDFNTPDTTESGYLAGMALAGVCGLWTSGHGAGAAPRDIMIAGVRDLDTREAKLLKDAGVPLLHPSDSDPSAIRDFAGTDPVWIHVDLDVLEPGHVPTFYPVNGGLSPDQLRDILQSLPLQHVVGLELVEFEAPDDKESCDAALAVMTGIVAPLLPAR